MPEMSKLVGALLCRRMLLMVSRMWCMSVVSFSLSLDRWTTIVLSVRFGGPAGVSFFSFHFLATFAHVFSFPNGVAGGGGGGWVGWVCWTCCAGWFCCCCWLRRGFVGWAFVFICSAGAFDLGCSRCCLPILWICCSRRYCPCLRSEFGVLRVFTVS